MAKQTGLKDENIGNANQKETENIPNKKKNKKRKIFIKYQGILFPSLVFVLSDKYPNRGVETPSEICPDKNTNLNSKNNKNYKKNHKNYPE